MGALAGGVRLVQHLLPERNSARVSRQLMPRIGRSMSMLTLPLTTYCSVGRRGSEWRMRRGAGRLLTCGPGRRAAGGGAGRGWAD